MDLRERLYAMLLRDPISWRSLGKQIGIHEQVLARFMEEKRKIRYSTSLKIEAWLIKKEKELGL